MQMSVSEDGLTRGHRRGLPLEPKPAVPLQRAPHGVELRHAGRATTRRLHNGRWSGLVFWWQERFGKLQESAPSRWICSAPTGPWVAPTPLPPDRPSGRVAGQGRRRRAGVPHRLAGPAAVQSGARVPLDAGLCLPEPRRRWEEPRHLTQPARAARRAGSWSTRTLVLVLARISRAPSSRSHRAIPTGLSRTTRSRREFLLGPVPEAEARQYLCNQAAAPAAGTPADYYAVSSRFG